MRRGGHGREVRRRQDRAVVRSRGEFGMALRRLRGREGCVKGGRGGGARRCQGRRLRVGCLAGGDRGRGVTRGLLVRGRAGEEARGRRGGVGGGGGALGGFGTAQLGDGRRGGRVVRTRLATVGIGGGLAGVPLGVVALVREHGDLVVRHAAVPLEEQRLGLAGQRVVGQRVVDARRERADLRVRRGCDQALLRRRDGLQRREGGGAGRRGAFGRAGLSHEAWTPGEVPVLAWGDARGRVGARVLGVRGRARSSVGDDEAGLVVIHVRLVILLRGTRNRIRHEALEPTALRHHYRQCLKIRILKVNKSSYLAHPGTPVSLGGMAEEDEGG